MRSTNLGRDMIRSETSKRNGIRNIQGFEISHTHRHTDAQLQKRYPRAKLRKGMSAVYNCHGLTFASRRTRIEETIVVRRILEDDCWKEIELPDVLPGDIVVYFSQDGDANHSGIVVDFHDDLKLPMICSKWNIGSEFIHSLSDCPEIYGPIKKFYRCQL